MPKEQPIDLLNDSVREVVYRRKNANLFKTLARSTHFNEREVEALSIIHDKCQQTRGRVNRQVFRDIFHSGLDFTENKRHHVIDRLFAYFDSRNKLRLSPAETVKGFSTILKGTLKERATYAYRIYDLMRTNAITKEQIFPIMRGCMIKLSPEEDPDEIEKDLVELVVKLIDSDRDGDIALEEFHDAVLGLDPLVLECMGPVLASRDARLALLTTFTDRLTDY